ncbi:MAG TPA: hypothetical protein PLX02_08335 [Syntrophorhabdaceae bacterium]|nr:hypothetical protein [Syntrophorhabdaceae bacterium]HQM81611.1 hypothetical protein [Syntrophorhabdaceae bacterium]
MRTRSFAGITTGAFLAVFLLAGLACTVFAQQPAGKIMKRDIPQPKIDPQQTRAVMEGKMLGSIKVASLSVQDPQPQCIGEWNAALVNPNNADLTFAVEVFQFDAQSGQWHSVGPAQSVQLAKNEQKSLKGQWERRMHARKLKLSIKRALTPYKEHEITLPALPAPNVEITGIYNITDAGFKINIRNNGVAAQCFLGRQCYKMAEQGGPTTGGLGGGPIRLPGNYTSSQEIPREAGWKAGVNFIKCDIRNLVNDTIVTTKIVPMSQ